MSCMTSVAIVIEIEIEMEINSLVGACYHRYIYGIIRQIKHYQSRPFHLEPIPIVQEYLSSLTYLSENALYVESTKREARKKQGSGSSLASIMPSESGGRSHADTMPSPLASSYSSGTLKDRSQSVTIITNSSGSGGGGGGGGSPSMNGSAARTTSSSDKPGTELDTLSSSPTSSSLDASDNGDDESGPASPTSADARANRSLDQKSNSWVAQNTIQPPSLLKIKRSPRRHSSPANEGASDVVEALVCAPDCLPIHQDGMLS